MAESSRSSSLAVSSVRGSSRVPVSYTHLTVFLQELPKELLRLLFSLQTTLQDWLETNPEADAHAQLLELYFALQDITRAAERYDRCV